jgi:hypothetical protein
MTFDNSSLAFSTQPGDWPGRRRRCGAGGRGRRRPTKRRLGTSASARNWNSPASPRRPGGPAGRPAMRHARRTDPMEGYMILAAILPHSRVVRAIEWAPRRSPRHRGAGPGHPGAEPAMTLTFPSSMGTGGPPPALPRNHGVHSSGERNRRGHSPRRHQPGEDGSLIFFEMTKRRHDRENGTR